MITKDIQQAVHHIKQGRIAAFPTGTAYGLAVDALQGHALQRLRNIKKRTEEKTFTVMAKEEIWNEYFNLTEEEKTLIKKHAHTALTVLIKPKQTLMHIAQNGKVGLRLIDHPLMQKLAQAVDVPLTATSANISGEKPCYTPECVKQTFPGKIDETTYDLSLGCILNGGNLPEKQSSTIITFKNRKIEIIRKGSFIFPEQKNR